VATLLVGFGWFVNFRVYERDKVALERDLRAQMSEDARKSKIEASNTAIASSATIEQSLANKIAATEERITGETKKLLDALEKKITSRIAANASELSGLQSDVLALQLEEKLKERESWLRQKIPRNVLQASVSALELANKIDFQHDVGEVLDFVSTDLNEIRASNGSPIDNYLVAQLVAALDAVKGEHAYAAATLKQKATALISK
jgi:hypothetical protein